MSDELSHLAARAARRLVTRRAFFGRAAALGATAAMADSLLARAVQAAEPNKGGTLTMGLSVGQSTDTLDPAPAASWVHLVYLSTLGNMLVTVAPDGSAVPSLAESWEASPDAKSWVFTIRKGVEFHNGKTMTPEDVLLTLKRHADPKAGSGAYGQLLNIDNMKVDGDKIHFTLKSGNVDLPYVLSDYHLIIQPGGGMDDPAAGIFTGPYKLKDFVPGIRVDMEKFENHWDPTVGHFDKVNLLVINDAAARNAALRSGEVQMINQVEPRVADLLKRVPDVAVPSVTGHGFNAFNMFCNTAPFDDNNMRMALKLAVDREQMLKTIRFGYGSVGNDMPVGPTYPLFDTTIPQREYDPDQAAYFYKKTGHSGDLLLRTSEAAFSGGVGAAELFQQSAKKAGISIKIKVEPSDGYWSEVWNEKPFHATYWGPPPTQGLMYSTNYLSTSPWNDTRFRVPEFDSLIEKAQTELDTEKRKELYSEASRYIRDNGGLINFMFYDFISGYRTDRVAGWVDNPNQDMMNGLAAVKCWQV